MECFSISHDKKYRKDGTNEGEGRPPHANVRGRPARVALPAGCTDRKSKARKEATHVFYYLDPQDSEIENMTRLFADIRRILRNALDKSGED